MKLRSCLVSFLLFEALSALHTEQYTTPNLTYESTILRIKNECSCSCDDWQDGVLKYYEGTSQLRNQYPAPVNQAEPLMSAFEIFLNKLLDITTSNSTILSSSSTAVLDAMSKLSKMSGSYGNLLDESAKRLPKLSIYLRKIVSDLSDYIGEVITDRINIAISGVEESVLHFAFTFRKCGVELFGKDYGSKLNYKQITKSTQVLMNLLALIAETTINECNVATPKILESLAVLTLISNYYFFGGHSIHVVAEAILHIASQQTPHQLHLCLVTTAPLLQQMAKIIDYMGNALQGNIEQVLNRLVNFVITLNEKLDAPFGSFDGIDTNVWQITKSLETAVNRI